MNQTYENAAQPAIMQIDILTCLPKRFAQAQTKINALEIHLQSAGVRAQQIPIDSASSLSNALIDISTMRNRDRTSEHALIMVIVGLELDEHVQSAMRRLNTSSPSSSWLVLLTVHDPLRDIPIPQDIQDKSLIYLYREDGEQELFDCLDDYADKLQAQYPVLVVPVIPKGLDPGFPSSAPVDEPDPIRASVPVDSNTQVISAISRSPQPVEPLIRRLQTKLAVPADFLRYLKPFRYRYHPQPTNDIYPVDENDRQSPIEGVPGWVMAGASRRGFSHWDSGSFRDDAFRCGTAGNWNVIAVSDGAGSATYSRQTATQSVAIAVQAICNRALPIPTNPADSRRRMDAALREAITAVHSWQTQFTNENGYTKKETYATLMLLIHQPFPDGNSVTAGFQIGDGLSVGIYPVENKKKGLIRISEGLHGSAPNETHFVLMYSPQDLYKHIRVHDRPFEFFMVMTDGIENDLTPSVEAYNNGRRTEHMVADYIKNIRAQTLVWPRWQQWGQFLDQEIDYERADSFDDRTLVVLTLAPASGEMRR